MHFSSAFLSTTAILAQAASGFYLLRAGGPLSHFGYVRIRFEGTTAAVAFEYGTAYPFAAIHLDADGDIGTGFLFRKPVGSPPGFDAWEMHSRAASSIEEGDITQPFNVDEDNRFVYQGAEGGVWNVCPGPNSSGSIKLYLSTKPMTADGCTTNVTLIATEIV